VLRYLSSTSSLGIRYTRQGNRQPIGFSDADFASDSESKSTSGTLIKLANGPIMWGCKKQTSTALSTTEAEYIAASEAGKDIQWIRALFAGLDCPILQPTILFCDNNASVSMIKSEENPSKRRHILARYHYIKSLQSEKEISVQWIATQDQEADLFTKAFARVRFAALRNAVMGHASAPSKQSSSDSSQSHSSDAGISSSQSHSLNSSSQSTR
jgi:hypothetical protein